MCVRASKSAFPWYLSPAHVCLLISWLRAPGLARAGSPVPAGRLPWQRPFVRHQHPKMSNCFQRVRPCSLPPSPSPFSIPVTSAQVANSLVSMGTEEGCLSFSVPNICLYKQWCAAPPPSGPGFGLGEEVLCLSRGVGFLAPLGLASVGWRQPWTLGAPGRRGRGGGRCLVGGAAALHSVCGPPGLCFAGRVALDRLPNLSRASVSSSVKGGC